MPQYRPVLACFYVYSKRGLSKRGLFQPTFSKSPDLLRPTIYLHPQKPTILLKLAHVKLEFYLARTKPACQKTTIFGHGNRLFDSLARVSQHFFDVKSAIKNTLKVRQISVSSGTGRRVLKRFQFRLNGTHQDTKKLFSH